MQLSTLENLSKENIIFHEPKEYQLKNSNIKYKRIKIETKYPNGKTGALVLETPFLFSFGVNERKNQDTDQLTGYSIPVCLWKKDEKPNQEEEDFYDALINFTIFVKIILQNIMEIMEHQVLVKYYITNKLNM